MNIFIHSLISARRTAAGFCLLMTLALWFCQQASAQTITAELAKVIAPDGFDAVTIIPEGQSATLTVVIRSAPSANVTVRLSVAAADRRQVALLPAELILSSESTQAQALVRVINDDTPEGQQTIDIVLTPEDGNITVQDTPTFTIPQSYSNVAFCEALNTIGNCPAFFTLPDSHAAWHTAERPAIIGPTVLSSGNTGNNQRSCLSFITQQPTRILFDWRVSSEDGFDGIIYIDENNRSARLRVIDGSEMLSNTAKLLTGNEAWINSKFDYSGDGLLMLEWCYAKDDVDKGGEDAGFLDNLQIIPLGSVQARLLPTRIPELGSADLVLFHNLEQDTTVKMAFAKGTPENARIDRLRSKELKLRSSESRTIAALTIEDDGIFQEEERSGTLTMALSPDNQAVMLSSNDFAFTIPKDAPVTAKLPKLITPDGFDDMTIIPEGQSATLTVAVQPSFTTSVTVRLSVTQLDPPQITLSTTQLVLSPESNQVPVIVHVISDNVPEGLQTIDIVLTAEDDENLPVQDALTFTITIPQSYSNVAFCEALNTINCPAFFTLPDSHAAWRTAEIPATIGPTALSSGNIGNNQRSCLSFITQQPTRILFEWRVSSEDGSDGIFYIDENDRKQRLAKVGSLRNTAKSLTGNKAWVNSKFDYSGDGLLMLEWCYAKDGRSSGGEDAGFLDDLQIIPPGSVQARLFPTRIPELGRADLALFHNLEQDTTVKLAFADGAPENARIDRLRSKELKLRSSESRTIAALTIEDDGIFQKEERSGALTVTLSPDNQAVMLSSTEFAFTISHDVPVTAELSKAFTPDEFDDMTIIPEGQSATLTVAFRLSFATSVTVRLSVTQADPPQVALSTTQLVLSPESNQVPVIVHVIDDNMPEDLQTIAMVLTAEDENLLLVQAALIITITIPQSYSNVDFCEALNTINCPVFFTLPDSHAPWRTTEIHSITGRTALRSGNINHNQRSCLSFITQQPTRILFDWRVSSEDGFDGIIYIDENNRSARLRVIGGSGTLSNTAKLLTGNEAWINSKFDYSGDGLLMLEWCYAKDGGRSGGEDAGFLGNLTIPADDQPTAIRLRVKVYLEGAL